MPAKIPDEYYIGKKYNRLTILDAFMKNRYHMAKCQCDCGKIVITRISALKNNSIKSCGCYQKEMFLKRITKHNQWGIPAYTSWDSMIQRCRNKKSRPYVYYGARGITVCDRWLEFSNFLEDMGNRPEKTELERIDNNKGYYKENCRWATRKEQMRNTRQNAFVEYKGEKIPFYEIESRFGIKRTVVWERLHKMKWSVEDALTIPTGDYKRMREQRGSINGIQLGGKKND